jgi:BlaI family penicillinase repressor
MNKTEIRTMSDAELTIMRIIWSEGGCVLLAPLMEKLAQMGKEWKSNTVLTFLSRLAEKEMLAINKQGRLNEYKALCSESEYTESLTKSFLGKYFDGSAKNLIASLLQQDFLIDDEIAELKEYWQSRRKDD